MTFGGTFRTLLDRSVFEPDASRASLLCFADGGSDADILIASNDSSSSAAVGAGGVDFGLDDM